MPEPLVSIIIPTKNRKDLLVETLESVRAQTYPHWEAIVVDDGSDDGTMEKVPPRYANEPRIQFRRRESERGNANVCRNEGFRASKGDYIIFLDSDDLLMPECLEGRVRIMERNLDLDFVTSLAREFVDCPREDAPLIREFLCQGALDRFLHHPTPWQTTGPIWRRRFLDMVGSWDETLPSWQDWDFHVRALCLRPKFLEFPSPDYYLRTDFFNRESIDKHIFSNAKHLRTAATLLDKTAATVREAGIMTFTRQCYLAGSFILLAERLASSSLGDAIRVWRRCHSIQLIGLRLLLEGTLYLFLVRLRLARYDSCIWSRWKWRNRLRY